jgi:hypothetical protein
MASDLDSPAPSQQALVHSRVQWIHDCLGSRHFRHGTFIACDLPFEWLQIIFKLDIQLSSEEQCYDRNTYPGIQCCTSSHFHEEVMRASR